MNPGQHYMTPEAEEPFRSILPALAKTTQGKTIIEFGFGHGELTRLILELCNPAKVVGYEIDPNLTLLPEVENDPRFEPHRESFLKAPWQPEPFIIMANPPYALLPAIAMMQRAAVAAMLMTPAESPFMTDWQVMFTLPGDAFNPPSKGEHVVKIRGFGEDLAL